MVNLLLNGFIPEVSSQIHTGYSKAALREVRNFEITDSAKSRTDVKGITIDKAESQDLDDGIWAFKAANGNYIMQISITDVAELIKPFSALDAEALDRATSVYLDTHVIHMFPKEIAANIGSLNDKVQRLSQTVEIELTSDYETVRVDVFESRFFNMQRYDHYGFFNDVNAPGIEQEHPLRVMYKIAQGLYFQRLGKLKMPNFEDADRTIQFGTTTFGDTEKNVSSFVVQEFMIKANIEIAKLMVRERVNGVFRNHMANFKDSESLPKDIERALYESEMKFHLGLGEDFYCHFTSPLRRYADLLVHRQMKRLLRGQEELYSQEEVQRFCSYINSQITALIELQKFRSIDNRGFRLCRKIKKKNGTVDVEDIKHHIKYHTTIGNKIPQATRNVIIECIKKSEKVPDWIMLIMVGSGDAEIISYIKEKVLGDKKVGRYYKLLGGIGEIHFTEQVQENDFGATVEFTLFSGEKKLYSTKRHASFPKVRGIPVKKSRKINYERYLARKKGLERYFNFLISGESINP